MKRNKIILSVLFLCLSSIAAFPHGGERHMYDMMAVLGLDMNTPEDPNHPNKKAKKWCKYITNDLIDNSSFHDKLYNKYGISFRGAQLHRYLFHWGYDAKPWSAAIESKIIQQAPKTNYTSEYLIEHIKSDLREEQSRRNRSLNAKTEELFGFAHGGKEGKYARFFAAMAYNIHILGDYESVNTVFAGLCNLDDLIGMLVIEIRNFDKNNCTKIIKGITDINNTIKDNQKKADKLMEYLKTTLPLFISQAHDGRIKRRLEKRGFKFIKSA